MNYKFVYCHIPLLTLYIGIVLIKHGIQIIVIVKWTIADTTLYFIVPNVHNVHAMCFEYY